MSGKKRGFTLIELLIVIAIIGILATIIIIAYTNAQAKARDNKRKADIQAISSAVEMYYVDKKIYPFVASSNAWYRVRSVNTVGTGKRWSEEFNGLLNGYIPTPLTEDPKNIDNSHNNTTWHTASNEYFYTYGSSKYSYVLAARLEVLADGNGDRFERKTVKDASGSPIPLGVDALTYTIAPNQLFFVGANLITP